MKDEEQLELYTLRSEVYKRTGWDAHKELEGGGINGRSPQYTSDFLSKKLKGINIEIWHNGHVVVKKPIHDGVPEKVDRKYHDTVKVEAEDLEVALLKLVLALDDAGVKL